MKLRLLVIAFTLIGSINIYSQAQLIQTFEESNKFGTSFFGSSVSGAGDVNNDGFDDIIVGAVNYNAKTGRAYIFFGGNQMDNTPDVIIDGEEIENQFGSLVSGAGDVNNDGYDDIIIGALGFNANTERVYIYFGGNPMNDSTFIVFDSEKAGSRFGCSAAGTGDLNNDGYDDIIIGADAYNSTGRAYIYFGGTSMDSAADVIFDGEEKGDLFGSSVSGAGDINNDGYDDIVIGALGFNSGTGRAYLYSGGTSMNDSALIIFDGEERGNRFGSSVTGVGDVNNDSYDDIIIASSGQVHLYYGGTLINDSADVNFISGESSFGSSVADAGDLNNDGYDDIIIGAPNYNTRKGRVYIYYGGNSMDSIADMTFDGEENDNYFGASISGAGDINNDGYDDIIIGAFFYNKYTGKAYLYTGGNPMNNNASITFDGELTENYFSFSICGAGDVNNDGYDDIVVGAYGYDYYSGQVHIYYGGNPMNNIPDVTMIGEEYDQLGYTVSRAGDVNNDGYDDIIAVAYGYNLQTGRAYIYFGGETMDSIPDVTFTGEGAYNLFGLSVSGVGDLNNDDYDDIVIGAAGYSSHTGRVYIYLGGNLMNGTPDLTIDGEETFNRFGRSVSGAGDINNDGYDDIVVGADGYNDQIGRIYLFLGGNPIDSKASLTIDGEGDSSVYNFGYSVSGIGDVNNDSYDDIIAVAYEYNYYPGKAYIYFGGNSVNKNSDLTFDGVNSKDHFGYSVSGVGDINNDGYDDIAISAEGYNSSTGRVDIYYGGNPMNNYADITINGEKANSHFGYSVSNAGDVNDDGYNDIAIGAYGFNSHTGRAYIYSDPSAPVVGININLESPVNFELAQNYPNPFNPTTTINYSIKESGLVTLKVYNMLGEEIITLVNSIKQKGNYDVQFNASDLASGVYLYRLNINNYVNTKKMILIK